MEIDAADERGEGPKSHPGEQLFNVVYDPRFDRFFLEDEAVYRGRSRTIERKAISIPWEKWILPPKSPSKHDQQGNAKPTELQPVQAPANDSIPAPATEITSTLATSRVHENPNCNVGQDNQTVVVPTLDFSSYQYPFEAASQHPRNISADPAATTKAKTRIQNYTAHFKRTNQDVAKIMAAGVVNAEPNDEHEIKWNGEVLRVQFPALEPQPEITVSGTGKPDALQQELLRGSADEQWPGSTYELKNLVRIRAHADGLRGVNLANHFVAVSSSESSDSEEEVKIPPQQESEDENELMPVFFRDDRVLFHAKRRRFKGTVRRRISKSDFYNIRADNGSLFEAVLASKMELLDELEEPPYYDYARGDKVLWVSDIKDTITNTNSTTRRHRGNNNDEELTYKAKIMQVRSLERFDLLLRTGRVVKKVPYEEIWPRDVSDFVSTTTSRRR